MAEIQTIEFRYGAVRSCDYDAESQTLVMNYKNGRQARYAGVPRDVVDALVGAEPATGPFVAHHIQGVFEAAEA